MKLRSKSEFFSQPMIIAMAFIMVSVIIAGLVQAGGKDHNARASASLTAAGLVRAYEGRLPELLSCLREKRIALIGAHRGGPLPEYPENAIATMERTASRVPVFIETDVQQTSDGVLFMNHDDSLERNTTGKGLIREHTWAEIKNLKQRDTTDRPTIYRPPLLVEVLRWAEGRALVLLDVKPDTDIDLLVSDVKKAKADGRVMYLAYTVEQGLGILTRLPNAVLVMPVLDRSTLTEVKKAGLVSPRLIAIARFNQDDADFFRDLEALGITVMAGSYGGTETPDAVYKTIKDAGAYQALMEKGPRLIISNRPMEAAAALLADPEYKRKLMDCGIND